MLLHSLRVGGCSALHSEMNPRTPKRAKSEVSVSLFAPVLVRISLLRATSCSFSFFFFPLFLSVGLRNDDVIKLGRRDTTARFIGAKSTTRGTKKSFFCISNFSTFPTSHSIIDT